MADPFTIRIFVPDGDPEGIRLIDRMNWTGLGIVFPRGKWPEVRRRAEMLRTGIYILVGYRDEDDDLPTVYVGQADGVRNRIDSHNDAKDFWDWGVVFVSNSGGLNRAHVTWLEHALVRRATEAKRCHLDNGNAPQEPALSEAEKADTQGFLKEILQILPLVGLRAFEHPKAVAAPHAADPSLAPYRRVQLLTPLSFQPNGMDLKGFSWVKTAGTRSALLVECSRKSNSSLLIKLNQFPPLHTMLQCRGLSLMVKAENIRLCSLKRPIRSALFLLEMRRRAQCKVLDIRASPN